jgi:uncharacterized OB-fold protein
MADPVKSIITPIRLSYDYSAGTAATKFLRGLAKGKLLGATCPSCQAVYVPPRGSCPKCAVATEGEVELKGTGTIISFSIVRVPSENLSFELPYACISVLLDGAGLPFFHIVQDCELSDVRMGMRVKARWVAAEELAPSIGSIECFVPSGEPDADYETYKEHC